MTSTIQHKILSLAELIKRFDILPEALQQVELEDTPLAPYEVAMNLNICLEMLGEDRTREALAASADLKDFVAHALSEADAQTYVIEHGGGAPQRILMRVIELAIGADLSCTATIDDEPCRSCRQDAVKAMFLYLREGRSL